ncbi:interleukin-12 subunit alpha-like [Centropristis striata]|uniref:interleukin-12 subunit alpha-like n=1 Tax=Centropristis striata TaxID=184440 RepID=UPI0027E129E6|nr:interleukin-12 subunit alpha-like [Centropristis striata]
MSLIKLFWSDFNPALLLLVLACAPGSQSVPVMSKGLVTDSCVLYAHTLLQNITDVLTQNNLFSGIDCTKQSVEVNMETDTPSVCAPKESACSGIIKSEFDQDLCLTNIGKDLQHYYTFLSAQPDPDRYLAPTVLFHLREFMENCFTWSLPTDSTLKEGAADRPSTYDERLSLCKVLKGFQLRSITINRVISYMNSGEHTK